MDKELLQQGKNISSDKDFQPDLTPSPRGSAKFPPLPKLDSKTTESELATRYSDSDLNADPEDPKPVGGVFAANQSDSYLRSRRKVSVPVILQGARTVDYDSFVRKMLAAAILISIGCAGTTSLCIAGIGLAHSTSVSLVFFSIFLMGCFLFSLAQIRRVWNDTRGQKVPTWEWHHNSFIKSSFILLWVTLWFIPAAAIYLLHAIGESFVDLLRGSGATFLFLCVLLIILSIAVTITNSLTFYFAYYTLKFRWRVEVEKPRATFAVEERVGVTEESDEKGCGYIFLSKLLAISAIAGSSSLAAIYFGIGIATVNEGAWTSFVIYTVATISQVFFSFGMLTRTNRSLSWFMKFRVSTGVHLLISYFFFWINLILLVLVKKHHTGFWEEVAQLPFTQKSMIWAGLASYALVVISCVWSIWLHKFTKGQQWANSGLRELEAHAVDENKLPEATLEGIEDTNSPRTEALPRAPTDSE